MADKLEPLDETSLAVQKAFERELNQHGFGFQHAVIERALKLYNGDGTWRPAVAEIPVDQGPGTKIDLILETSTYETKVFLIGECKRVNPAFSDWCFIPSPFTHERRRRRSLETLSLECLTYNPLLPVNNPPVHIEQRNGLRLERAYQIGLAIKGQSKGETRVREGTGRDAIEAAASQVLRGLNGFVNTLVAFPDMLNYEKVNILLPVIFTTVQLWVSAADLSKADLDSGDLNIENQKFERVNWIFYQYHTSTGLKHSHVIEREIVATFEHLMDSEYIRTIVIVGRGGLNEFLNWSAGRDFLSGYVEA